MKSWEPLANVNSESLAQLPKQYWESVSIDDGMQIDRIDEQYANACSPRNEIWEPNSNVTLERLKQQLKHAAEIASTDDGIETARSDEQ
jgi:hypothetical protein